MTELKHCQLLQLFFSLSRLERDQSGKKEPPPWIVVLWTLVHIDNWKRLISDK